jgi:CubicO group peptidase (beta-lactamase class C family)
MSLSKFTVAGVAVAIVKDGEIIHQKGYGIKSLESKEAVDEQTNFAVASNTKAFTTAALAILVEEGKFPWLAALNKKRSRLIYTIESF